MRNLKGFYLVNAKAAHGWTAGMQIYADSPNHAAEVYRAWNRLSSSVCKPLGNLSHLGLTGNFPVCTIRIG